MPGTLDGKVALVTGGASGIGRATALTFARESAKLVIAEMSHMTEVAGASPTSAHPRFQGMALTAHAIATGINTGKVAVYGGNPLAINDAQWLRFLSNDRSRLR